jgi:hypothetical protein
MKLEEYVLALFYSNLFTCSSLVIKNWAPYTDPLGRIRVKMLISSVQYQIITIWPQFGGRNMSSKIGRSALHRSGKGGTAARTVTTCPLVVKWKHAKGACVVLAGPGIFHISLSVLFHLVLFSSSKHSTKTNNEWPSEGDKIPSPLCVMFIHKIYSICVSIEYGINAGTWIQRGKRPRFDEAFPAKLQELIKQAWDQVNTLHANSTSVFDTNIWQIVVGYHYDACLYTSGFR